jgi:hypothetical protein
MANQGGNDLSGQGNATDERRDSGMPGGGAGRRDEIGHTGIYPYSASQGASGDAPVIAEGAFGQGDRGVEGYDDSGSSGFDAFFDQGTSSTSAGGLMGDSPADQAGAGSI